MCVLFFLLFCIFFKRIKKIVVFLHHENLFINQNVIVMKKALSFVAGLFAVVALNAQFVADFEDSNLSGWAFNDADGDGYGWVLASESAGVYFVEDADLTGSGHEASYDMVMSGSYSNLVGALTPDNYLITPNLTLSAGATLTFWCTAQDASYAAEHYAVLVSTTGTAVTDFTTVFEETFTAGKAQAGWQQKTVDLSSYAGQNVYIAFRHFNCTDQFVFNLDDVTVTNATVATGIVENNIAFSIYPNPATTVLNVNAEGYNTLEIVNLLGQTVYTANATSNMQINVSNLNNGVYFVRMNGENGTATQKFIKK